MENNEHKPFGELSRDEKIALFAAWVDGKNIELLSDGGNWNRVLAPSWDPTYEYRIAPTKPSIDWSHVAPRWKYLAVEGNGQALLFDAPIRAHATLRQWRPADRQVSFAPAEVFASFAPGTCDWRESLVERPEGV